MSQAGPPGPPPGPPPPPPPSGPPLGPAPDASPGGGNVDRRRLGWIVAAIAVVAAVVVAVVLASQSGDDDEAAEAQEVLLEPATTDGPFPWTGSVAHEDAPTSVPLPPTSTLGATTTGSSAARLTAVSGDRVGIYGGTTQLSVCDTQQLVSFLEQNPQRGAAWARVLGLGGTQIRSYVSSLTPVVLAADTRVTNHGYRDGRATPRQSVLQAGTAVLIDNRGVPRVRCYCGNPLVEPVVRGAPTYTGTKWPSFTPERIIVVQPASQPIQQITTINVNTGGPLVIPAGGTTTAPAPASTAPPVAAGTTTTASPRPTSPPTGSAPAAGTPSTLPRFTPPPAGTQPSAATYQLASIRVSRAYGGFIDDDLAYANAVQPGSSTVGPGERRFQVGWDFRWPRETMVNRNRAMGTVTFTQLATTIVAGTPAPLQVTMTGEWDTSGYGVDRRHTIALSGPGVAPVSREVPGPPSGSLQGSITTTQGSSPPVTSGSRAVVQVTANINFGDDHTGQLVIELVYERT